MRDLCVLVPASSLVYKCVCAYMYMYGVCVISNYTFSLPLLISFSVQEDFAVEVGEDVASMDQEFSPSLPPSSSSPLAVTKSLPLGSVGRKGRSMGRKLSRMMGSMGKGFRSGMRPSESFPGEWLSVG